MQCRVAPLSSLHIRCSLVVQLPWSGAAQSWAAEQQANTLSCHSEHCKRCALEPLGEMNRSTAPCEWWRSPLTLIKCLAGSLTQVLHQQHSLLAALAPAPPWKTQSRMEKLSVPKLLLVLPPGKGDGKLCSTRPVRRRLTVQQLLAMTRHRLPSGRGMASLHRRCASYCGCLMSPAAESKTHAEAWGPDVSRWQGRACYSTSHAHQADPRSGGTSVIHSGCMSCPA